MGLIVAKLMRPVKNYNIENRAHRELERQRKATVGIASPRHARGTQEKEGDIESRSFGEEDEKIKKLIERVGHMDIKAEVVPSKVDQRPLPHVTESTPDYTYGFYIPANVPKGKVTLPQIVQILCRYKDEYPRYTSHDIAAQYDLSPTKAAAIVKHFQMLNIFLPKKVLEKASELQRLDKSNVSLVERLTSVTQSDENSKEKSEVVNSVNDEVKADSAGKTDDNRTVSNESAAAIDYDIPVSVPPTSQDDINRTKTENSSTTYSDEKVNRKTTS